MNKILIIGAGFAGLSASRRLSRIAKEAQVILVDKNSHANFLPLLPDVFGRGVNPDFLLWPLERVKKWGVDFINAPVTAIDLSARSALVGNSSIGYDYLLLSCGSETNFYGDNRIRQASLKLDDSRDAGSIALALEKMDFGTCLVCGGGYTGIEIACGLRMHFRQKKIDKEIIIVERAPQILGPLPGWMRDYVSRNLSSLGISVSTGVFIEGLEEGSIRLSSGRVLEKALLIWAAGVSVPGFIQGLNIAKNPQGRIRVDEYLSFAQGCFAAGDVAAVPYKNSFLRMAVQFSMAQGELAAVNIARHMKGSALKKYRPRDLGYIIPMANNRSCGRVMGLNVSGLFATCLHYSMCVYRSSGVKNKFGLLSGLLKGG